MLADPIFMASSEPRVVILDQGPAVAIEVVELPSAAGVGTEFCHRGGRWRITGHRPRSRVLLAKMISPHNDSTTNH